jgi:hypothetical protein
MPVVIAGFDERSQGKAIMQGDIEGIGAHSAHTAFFHFSIATSGERSKA